ncbi:lipopolysaccharide biosynthesis protein [Aureimonas sp. SA4125]|uniref:lipopolysaccharide biosynthesis protein n=1 Tax=Aureimonas sp. SA4125 TaxID=2826993 RepID=UPI001CC58D8E|nr:lipopolysaccharide biosynthesis protein [Aureimonas sp. SA4125]BDA83380.1 lipopolysaccharide biosynthesis protein [Aureimonas sp. SA4125]
MRGVIWSSVTVIVPTLTSSAVFIISSRYLSPVDFGLVALAASIGSFVSAIAPAAFAEALVQRSQISRSHLDTIFWLCFGSSLVLYALLIALSEPIARLTGAPLMAALLPVLGSRVLFDLAAAVPNALIIRSMRFNLFALRTTVAAIVSGILCIGLLLFGFGLWALAVSQVTVSVIACVASFLSVEWRPRFAFSLQSLRQIAHYGIFASGNRFMQMMSLDQIAFGSLAGPAALGIFNFARRVFLMLNDVIAGALGNVSHTLLSSLQNDQRKVREAFLLATYGSALISFPAFAGLAIVADDVVPLIFDPKWIPAVLPLQGFCAIGLLSCIGVIQASLFKSQNREAWWFYYQLISQVATILIVAFGYSYGVDAVVIAIAVKTYLFWPASVGMASRLVGISQATYLKQFLAPAGAALAMAAVVLGLRHFLSDEEQLLRLAIEVFAGGLVYLVIVAIASRHRLKPLVALVRARRQKLSVA